MKHLMLLLVLLASGAAVAGGTADEVPTVDDAIARARATGKPLILEFWTEWCKPCKEFERDVLPLPEVQKALEDVTFVRYDAESGNGVAAAKRYGIDSFPNFLAIDENGLAVLKQGGMGGPDHFMDFLGRAAGQLATEDALKTQLQKAPNDARLLLRAARWYQARQRTAEALRWFEAAQTADPKNALGIRGDAAWEAADLRRVSELRTRIVTELAGLASAYPAAQSSIRALTLATVDSGLPEPRIKGLYAAVIAAASHGYVLRQIAYDAMAAGYFDAALSAASRAAELSPKDPEAWTALADAHHYRGEREAALTAVDKAIELAPPPLKPTLTASRTRYESASPRAAAVEERKARVAAYWKAVGSIPMDIPVMGAPSAPPPGVDEYMRYTRTLRAAFAKAGETCEGKRAALTEAWVRMELAENGGKPARVTLLEPEAPAGLRECLVEALASHTFDKPVAMMGGNRYTDRVPLQQAGPGGPMMGGSVTIFSTAGH
jgi:thioredoxin-like negative regulator of GroEL